MHAIPARLGIIVTVLGLGPAVRAPETFAAPALETAKAARYVPMDVAVVATLRDGDRQVQAFHRLLATHRFTESLAYQNLQGTPEFVQARVFLAGIAAVAQTDVWSGLGALLGRELVVGLAPGADDEPEFIAVSIPRDPELTTRVLRTALAVLGGDRPETNRATTTYGVTILALGDGLFHCRIDDAVVLSSDRDMIEAAIKCAREGGGLIDSPGYQDAASRSHIDAAVWVYGNMSVLGPLIEHVPKVIPDAFVAMLLGGWWHALHHAQSALVSAVGHENRLEIDLRIDSSTPLPETHRGFAPDHLPAPAWSARGVPGYLGEVTVARDWEDLFANRETLMTLSAASDFVNFTSTLTSLLGQVDFVDEILAKIRGPLTLVVARQDFSTASFIPMPELPAFGVVVPLDFPDAGTIQQRLHSGTLTAISVLNLQAAQNKQPTFLVDVDRHRNHRIVTARYLESETGSEGMGMGSAPPGSGSEGGGPTQLGERRVVGIQYNFASSAAVLSRHYVFASSPELLKVLIDAIHAPQDAAGGPVDMMAGDSVSVLVPELLAILQANQEGFVTNAMLEDDKTQAQAEQELETLLDLLGHIERADLTSTWAPQAQSATLTVELRRPEEPPTE